MPVGEFLGFDIWASHFSLETYVHEQVDGMPIATSLSQLRKMIGIVNVVRPFVLRLDKVLTPLLDQLSLPGSA